jgi:ribosome-associated protein
VDFGDVVIHLFHQEMRRYYELENLWADGKPVRWQAAAKPAGAAEEGA